MRKDKKERVMELRRRGLSYSEIKRIIPVAESSLVLWLKDIVLSEEQKERIRRKSDKIRLLASKSLKEARIKRTKEIINEAISEVGVIDNE